MFTKEAQKRRADIELNVRMDNVYQNMRYEIFIG